MTIFHQIANDKVKLSKVRKDIDENILQPYKLETEDCKSENIFEAINYERVFDLKYFALIM